MSAEVQVLLATYNGGRFLAQQIDSILAQTHLETTLLARDDGSTDDTPAILAGYAARYPQRVTVLVAPSADAGAKGNFLTLLRHSTAPYVAFADQDDLWLPEKLARELAALAAMAGPLAHPSGTPLLCFSDLRVVDQDLHTLHESFWKHEGHKPAAARKLNRLLMQNVVAGCTMLMNRPLAELAAKMPPEAHMHDWWIALLACAFGRVTWLREPTVLYRQHGLNVFGASAEPAPTGLPDRANDGPRRLHWLAAERQAEALLRIYEPRLSAQRRRLLQAMVRCETGTERVDRVATLLGNRLWMATPRQTAAIALQLWDKR